MDIRNNPYFSHIRFYVNRGVVTLEITEGGGILGGLFGGSRTGGIGSVREEQRFNEYENMCKTIEQAVQDGKMGAFAQKAAPAAASAPEEPAAPPRPKFCTNCGAPAEGGKFCQSCGSPL
jgi:membrane protease subunit (stomatin/prohibitin family)